MANEKIETYQEAARVVHLWLKEFCNEKKIYPDMIAEAARRAAKEIERLRHLISQFQAEMPEGLLNLLNEESHQHPIDGD